MVERICRTVQALLERRSTEEDGFTLVELLIVIVVLGILAAVTVFGLSGSSSQSAVSACKSDARTVEVAVDAYHANDLNAAWPTGFGDLTGPAGAGQPANTQPYLRSAPNNPNHYTIALGPAGQVMVTSKTTGGTADFDAGNGAICDTVK